MSTDGQGIAARRSGDAGAGAIPGLAMSALAVSMGVAVPAAVLGKAAMGVALAPAVAVVLFALTRRDIRRGVIGAARGPTGLAFALFGLVSLVSVLLSQDLTKSLETWSRTAAFAVFALAAVQVLARDRRALALAKRCLVVAALLAMGHVVFAVHVSDGLLALIRGGADIELDAAIYFKGFGSAIACLLPVALWASSGPELGRKALRLALLVLAALAIWLDGFQVAYAGVLGILAMLVMLAVVALVGRVSANRRRTVAAAVGAGGVALALAITAALPTAQDTDPSQSSIPTWLVDHHRQVIWAFTLDAAARRPVIGHGPNTINFIEGAERTIPATEQEYLPSHPHNWAYEILSETGIAGLLSLCVALLLLLRRLAILALQGAPSGWAAVAVFGAFWGSSLVNFSIWSAWWQLTFCVLLALAVAGAMRPSASQG